MNKKHHPLRAPNLLNQTDLTNAAFVPLIPGTPIFARSHPRHPLTRRNEDGVTRSPFSFEYRLSPFA